MTDTAHYGKATFPPPRPFQVTAHEALRQGIRDGHKNQILMAPTGAGKTYLGLRIVYEALQKGKRAIFVCDRLTLIDQTSVMAHRYGLGDHGIIRADDWRTDYSKPFQIASAQTLARREWPDADVIIIDEAHTKHQTWAEHIPTCRAKVIGLSATPFSPGLGKLFANLVNATTMDALTQSGVLVPMRVFSCHAPDMTGAATSGGEWTDAAAADREMQILGDVVADWKQFAENRKTILFGPTIAHCEALCRWFVDAGVMAATFTADTTATQRADLLKEYDKADSALRILLTVEALAKGFDRPSVECIVDCRPLRKSLSTAIQMWGRGARGSPDTGKKDFFLLSHSGNIERFADDFTDIYFNGLDALDMGEQLDKTIRKEPTDEDKKGCPKCGYKPFKKRCMGCGFEIIKQSTVEQLPGVMREVLIGKKVAAKDHRHLWQQACAYARAYSVPDKQQGRARVIFKDITGDWPPYHWDLATTPGCEITKPVMNKIQSRNIQYAKGYGRAAA